MIIDLGQDRKVTTYFDHNETIRYTFVSKDRDWHGVLVYHVLPAEWDGPVYFKRAVHDEFLETKEEPPKELALRLATALRKVRYDSSRRRR